MVMTVSGIAAVVVGLAIGGFIAFRIIQAIAAFVDALQGRPQADDEQNTKNGDWTR